MGYYDVLEVVERLERDKIDLTLRNICDNIQEISERSVKHSLNRMICDGTLKRTIYYDKKGKHTAYFFKKDSETEGFINDIFKVITNIIR